MPGHGKVRADFWMLTVGVDMPGVVDIFVPSWSVLVFPMSNRRASFSKYTKSIFESTTYSERDIRFHSIRRNVCAGTCSGDALVKRIFAR